MDRMRRRHIRHLIVLGASDDRLPRVTAPAGVFTPDERDALDSLGVHIGGGSDGLDREYGTIYNCVTLPGDTLTLSYAAFDGGGAALRPSLHGPSGWTLDYVRLRFAAHFTGRRLA